MENFIFCAVLCFQQANSESLVFFTTNSICRNFKKFYSYIDLGPSIANNNLSPNFLNYKIKNAKFLTCF